MSNGELHLIGTAVIIAAYGDLLYALLSQSKKGKLSPFVEDGIAYLFAELSIVCFIMVALNLIPASQMPPLDEEKIKAGVHGSYGYYYFIYVMTVIASLGTVTLGARIDE